MPFRPAWTDELKARVAELYPRHSTQQIADILQKENGLIVTRNAVIGICFRMGLRSPVKEKIHPSTSHRYDGRKRLRNKPVPPGAKVIRFRPLKSAKVEPLNLTLLELPAYGCRYIAGEDRLYCGHPQADGSSYCAAHHALVWVSPRAGRLFAEAAE